MKSISTKDIIFYTVLVILTATSAKKYQINIQTFSAPKKGNNSQNSLNYILWQTMQKSFFIVNGWFKSFEIHHGFVFLERCKNIYFNMFYVDSTLPKCYIQFKPITNFETSLSNLCRLWMTCKATLYKARRMSQNVSLLGVQRMR